MTNTFSREDFHASGMGIEDVQITVLAWSSFTFQYKLNLLLSVSSLDAPSPALDGQQWQDCAHV